MVPRDEGALRAVGREDTRRVEVVTLGEHNLLVRRFNRDGDEEIGRLTIVMVLLGYRDDAPSFQVEP